MPCCSGVKCYNEGTKKCSGCGLVRYCNRECQSSDWNTHKSFCKLMKSGKPFDTPKSRVEIKGAEPFSWQFAELISLQRYHDVCATYERAQFIMRKFLTLRKLEQAVKFGSQFTDFLPPSCKNGERFKLVMYTEKTGYGPYFRK